MDVGPQPLDAILKSLGLDNEMLVKQSTQQLTFKQVQKARTGHRVSVNIQQKIVSALNACRGDDQYHLGNVFNY